MHIAKWVVRIAVTFAMVAVALYLGNRLWERYMLDPWTRDGRVRAEVVNIAPEVSGTIVSVNVVDNQLVHKGDVLFVIDPQRFQLALQQAEAVAESRHQTLLVDAANAKRRQHLTNLVASAEEVLQYTGKSAESAASYQEALASVDVARLDLERSTIRSPVNGYVTNLNLRTGDYAVAGVRSLSVLDSDSFWIAGYFEETKLRHIKVGAPARIRLMGYPELVTGHVESISRGIADTNDQADGEGLANVSPVFTWVRLAQRIPVRIHIDKVPSDIHIAAGMTCTVEIDKPNGQLAQ
ncbi:MAG: HlyD family secretion protein [Parvibaculaceae bacterium]|nr:HlyD family secretion protein [Parvibaculaceae bacterium]